MCVERVGDAQTRRCIHKAVHTQGSLQPPQEFCYARGVQGLAPTLKKVSRLSSEVRLVHNVWGKDWWCAHKAVHTQGGAHTRRSVATARVLLFKVGVGAGPCVE